MKQSFLNNRSVGAESSIPIQLVTPSHVGYRRIGISGRDLSTSSLTKRAIWHWQCGFHIWLPRSAGITPRSAGIRASRCTVLIHRFASEPSCGASLLLSNPASEKEQAIHYSAAAMVAVSQEVNDSREDRHTWSVRWPAPCVLQHWKGTFL